MRSLAIVILLAVNAAAQVDQSKPLDVAGVTQLVADKIKEAKGATVFSANAGPTAALYLPVWTFHNKEDTVDYLELGAGGQWRKGQAPIPVAVSAINLPGLSARAWHFPWADQHLKRSTFPPIFFGPTFNVPLEASHLRVMRWDHWLDYFGASISVRLGK